MIRENHKSRYDGVTTIPGTRSFHQFHHLGENKIGAKRCSSDYTAIHMFKKEEQTLSEITVTAGTYAAVVYEKNGGLDW